MIKSPKFNSFLLYLNVLILIINVFEITLLVWGITAILSLQFKYSFRFLKLISISLAIVFLAIISSFFYKPDLYDAIRDFTYLIKPILGLFIGYNLSKKIGEKSINVIVNVGVTAALIHILILLSCYFLFSIKHVNVIRHYGGYFNDFEVYVLLVLLFHKNFDLKYSKLKLYLFILILSISTILYFSRTNILQFIILFLGLKGYYKLTLKSIKYGVIAFILIISSYGLIYYSNPVRTGKGIEPILYKIKNAPIEPFKTKINKYDWKDFNDNFRSYENISTLRQMSRESLLTIFFGKGLGSSVDYGRKMLTTEGTEVRHAPILHNSYSTIFLKSGILGVIFLIIFLIYLPIRVKHNDITINAIKNLLFGTTIFLILSNWVFMGLYLKLDNKSIFIGFLICYFEMLYKEITNSKII